MGEHVRAGDLDIPSAPQGTRARLERPRPASGRREDHRGGARLSHKQTTEDVQRFLDAFVDHDTTDRLGEIAAPTFVLAGGEMTSRPELGPTIAIRYSAWFSPQTRLRLGALRRAWAVGTALPIPLSERLSSPWGSVTWPSSNRRLCLPARSGPDESAT